MSIILAILDENWKHNEYICTLDYLINIGYGLSILGGYLASEK